MFVLSLTHTISYFFSQIKEIHSGKLQIRQKFNQRPAVVVL